MKMPLWIKRLLTRSKPTVFKAHVILKHRDGDQITIAVHGVNAHHVSAIANGIRAKYKVEELSAGVQAAADEVWKAMDVAQEHMDKLWNHAKYDR